MLPQAATDFYATQQRVNRVTRLEVARLWRKMGSDFESSWNRVGPQVFTVIATAQLEVAKKATPYLDALAAQSVPSDVAGQVDPQSLVGWASDGRQLDTLAYGAVVKAGEAYNDGATQMQALRQGGKWLDLMTRLQVADAARTATSIGSCARPEWGGYVRMLNPPSCARCAVLAGKWFKWNQGFQRHPKCDCIHVPTSNARHAETEGFIANPDDAWRQGQIGGYRKMPDGSRRFESGLSRVQQKALEDGADISQLINARRGMSTTTEIKGTRFDFTLEGTTRRGVYGSSAFGASQGYNATDKGQRGYVKHYMERRSKRSRLTPETIYRVAENRADAIRLLKNYGYILP